MKFEGIKIPKKITPCPIIEAIIELRFEDLTFPIEIFLGGIFEKLKGKNPNKPDKLPVLELPSVIRENDPNLRFAPHYKIKFQDYLLQIGPRTLSIACPKEYTGWSRFYPTIEEVFDEIKNLSYIEKPLRFGLRYINFFNEVDIFEFLKIELKLGPHDLIGFQNIIKTEFNQDDFKCILQFANKVRLNQSMSGSIIDIDISTENCLDIFSNYKNMIPLAHTTEKAIFFSILKEDFLKKYDPKY